jgi:hypothetical protein
MSQKDSYGEIIKQRALPLFCQPWWLDITAGPDGWDVLISRHADGTLQAVWPFGKKQSIGFTRIFLPPYTPYLGPQLIYPNSLTEYERRSFEHKVIGDLISNLPTSRDIRFKWSVGYDNWMPFYWQGFEQTTRYTYISNPIANEEDQLRCLKNSVRRQIKKAEAELEVQESNDVTSVLRLYESSLEQQAASHAADEGLLRKLNDKIAEHQCGTVLEARSGEEVVAALYLVWDQDQMYYLYGGQDIKSKDSGAKTYLFWKALRMASERQLIFNFEGSMIPGVERFFRGFGAILHPVHFIYKRKFPFTLVGI